MKIWKNSKLNFIEFNFWDFFIFKTINGNEREIRLTLVVCLWIDWFKILKKKEGKPLLAGWYRGRGRYIFFFRKKCKKKKEKNPMEHIHLHRADGRTRGSFASVLHLIAPVSRSCWPGVDYRIWLDVRRFSCDDCGPCVDSTSFCGKFFGRCRITWFTCEIMCPITNRLAGLLKLMTWSVISAAGSH